MVDYIVKAAGAWFLGFFPLAEIVVAVPAAMASGLDDASVLVWTITGNFTPVLLITRFYDLITRHERLRTWLEGLVTEKAVERVNQWGVWFVLLATPWTGVWLMSMAAKTLGMESRRYLLAAFTSITVYATVILVLIRTGVATFSS